MEKNIFIRLEELHTKSIGLVRQFGELPEKDIKRKHIELVSSQIATSLITLKMCFKFFETNNEDFKRLLNNDNTQIENYIHVFKQSIIEAIIDTLLFQTELVLRILYSKLTGTNPTQERNINRIIAALFEDTENNWQKEEAKLFVLFWTMRNTIHTGGIYYKTENGYSITYKGDDYRFEYGKSFQFLANNNIINLVSDFLDSLNHLFTSQKVKDLGEIDHPSYVALGQS